MDKGRARSVEPRGPARRRTETVTPSPALTERQDRGKQAHVVAPLQDHAALRSALDEARSHADTAGPDRGIR